MTEDLKENPITEYPKKHPITEHPKKTQSNHSHNLSLSYDYDQILTPPCRL